LDFSQSYWLSFGQDPLLEQSHVACAVIFVG
jgi:hypothetical protein